MYVKTYQILHLKMQSLLHISYTLTKIFKIVQDKKKKLPAPLFWENRFDDPIY